MNIDNLAEIIKNLSPTVPLNRAIWSPEDVGDYLRVAPKTVTGHYACRPDFPEAMRLPSKGKNGRLRWKAAEIIAWVEGRG